MTFFEPLEMKEAIVSHLAPPVRDVRAWWRRGFMAIVLTVVESFLLVGAAFLIAAWPWLLSRLGLDSAAAAAVVQWLVAVLALLTSFAIACYFGMLSSKGGSGSRQDRPSMFSC